MNYYFGSDYISYELFTEVRNSGSPLWRTSAAGPQAIGVHSRGSNGTAGNTAVLITDAVYNQIKAWCASRGIELNNN